MTQKVYILLGPTSTGKTALAIDLCKKLGGEIISADSRQVIKYMDVGTGKVPTSTTAKVTKNPNNWQINDVIIWGYDLITPDKYFSAYDYALYALAKIAELQTQNTKKILLVGGTGFYIDVVTGRREVADSNPDAEFRQSLTTVPTENLAARLMSLNPEVVGKTDLHNRHRVIRALEKSLQQDRSNQAKKLPRLSDTEFVHIGLTAPRQVLYTNADTWLSAIWPALLTETDWLLQNGYAHSDKLRGLLYKNAVAVLTQNQTDAEAQELAKFDLHHYIKRQQTYFNPNTHIKWFDITDPKTPERILNLIE